MKQIKLDDPTYQMLQKIAPRKDPIGVTAHLIQMIRDAYDKKWKWNHKSVKSISLNVLTTIVTTEQ